MNCAKSVTHSITCLLILNAIDEFSISFKLLSTVYRIITRSFNVVLSSRFEKYIGGKYLGSLLTSALSSLARAGLFPAEPAPDALQTAHLSLFEEYVPTLF